ncbi:MAG TPA: hypothetical protein VEJ63_04215 [Planctomycetota bacterium]|nr:hypothetical protein [Planctomycetota bacterium]
MRLVNTILIVAALSLAGWACYEFGASAALGVVAFAAGTYGYVALCAGPSTGGHRAENSRQDYGIADAVSGLGDLGDCVGLVVDVVSGLGDLFSWF